MAVGRSASTAVLWLGLVLPAALGPAYAWQSAAAAATESPAAKPAFPKVSLGPGLQLRYAGEVSPDGKIRYLSKIEMFFAAQDQASRSHQPVMTPNAAKAEESKITNAEEGVKQQVPPTVELHQNEQTVADFQPPEHAVEVAKGRSVVGGFADSVVSLVYGGTPIFSSPEAVTTDSQHRVIVTDAGAHSVHVLAHSAKHSFLIAGGPGHRLLSPRSVAVDGDDNIYVADYERGLILIYGSSGEFVRTVGTFGDEALFAHPSGIAIDRAAGRLYVADPTRNTVSILDLKGYLKDQIENQAGEAKAGTSSTAAGTGGPSVLQPGELQYPQSVLVQNGKLVVVDAKRIHIFDLQGKLLNEFGVKNTCDWRTGPLPGLFMDAENRIYLSDPGSETVREYSEDGQLLGAFGRPGTDRGEFSAIAGMWADSTGQVYIVDAHRIQIYRMERH